MSTSGGRFAFPRKDYPEADGCAMSQARKDRGERAPSPFSRSGSVSYRSRSPQAARSQDQRGSSSLSGAGGDVVVSGLWHERLQSRRREPSKERSNMLVQQLTNELSKESPWVSNLVKSSGSDSELIRSAKVRIFALSQKWARAEKEALSVVHAADRDISATKAAIADLTSRIAEKEQTMNAVAGMTALIHEKLTEMENEAYLRGLEWERPAPPLEAIHSDHFGSMQPRRTDSDTFSIVSEPMTKSGPVSTRDLGWTSSPIQLSSHHRRGSERQALVSASLARGRSLTRPLSRAPSPSASRQSLLSERGQQEKGPEHVRPWRGGGVAIAASPSKPARSRSPALERPQRADSNRPDEMLGAYGEIAFSESLNSPYVDDHQAYFEKKRFDAVDEFQRIRQEQQKRKQPQQQQQQQQQQVQRHANISEQPVPNGHMNAQSPGPYMNRWADTSTDDLFGHQVERDTASQGRGPTSRMYENVDLQKLADEYNDTSRPQSQRYVVPSLDFGSQGMSVRAGVTISALKGETNGARPMVPKISATVDSNRHSTELAVGQAAGRPVLQPSQGFHMRSHSWGSQSSDDWTQIQVSSSHLQAHKPQASVLNNGRSVGSLFSEQTLSRDSRSAPSVGMLRVNSPGTISSGPVLSYPVQQTDVTSIRGPLPKPFVQSTGYSQSGSANTVAPEYFDTDERFFQSNSNVKGSNIDSSKSAVSTPRQMISTPEFKPESTASFDSTDQRRPSVGRSPPSFTSENIRIVYEKFRGIINPKNSKGAAQDSGSSAEVSGILGKKIIDRFAVSRGGHSFELDALEIEISRVAFFPGLSNTDIGARNGFHTSNQAQCDWLCRVAADIFECTVTVPEAKAVTTCLRKSCELDPSLNELDSYLIWPRIIAIAVKTVPLVGSKSAGIRLVSSDPQSEQNRSLSAGHQRKKIGDLTQPHRRGSMMNMEKGWNTNFTKRKANSRKSFGNVFAAAAAEDEKRAELESKILQQSSGASAGSGWIGGPPDGGGNSSPKPSDASMRVLNSLKAFVSTHNIPIKDIRIEFNRIFPHGDLDTINDVRSAVKIIGRNQISSADIHSLVKYLDAVGQWRGDRKMRWADLIDFLTSNKSGV